MSLSGVKQTARKTKRMVSCCWVSRDFAARIMISTARSCQTIAAPGHREVGLLLYCEFATLFLALPKVGSLVVGRNHTTRKFLAFERRIQLIRRRSKPSNKSVWTFDSFSIVIAGKI